jgi:hypothetical protein
MKQRHIEAAGYHYVSVTAYFVNKLDDEQKFQFLQKAIEKSIQQLKEDNEEGDDYDSSDDEYGFSDSDNEKQDDTEETEERSRKQ